MSLVSLILEQELGKELTNKTGMQNWGGNLAADFEEFKGYSLVPWLLAATGRIINSTESQRPQKNSYMIFDLHTLISLRRNITDISIKGSPRMDWYC
jgi:hypothetical protein